MRYLFKASLWMGVVLLTDCEYSSNHKVNPEQLRSGKLFEGRTIYVATDSSDALFVEFDNNKAKLHSLALSNDFILPRVQSASGEKYENSSGYFFWTKGSEFMWGRHDSIWARGHQEIKHTQGR